MTVAELIEKLAELPSDRHVYVEVDDTDCQYAEAESVSLDDDGDVVIER